jgi:hypothetical protein
MSLTSHLDDTSSPIGQFLRTRFAQTATVTRVTNTQLRALTTLRPQPLSGETYPYGGIGCAIDYRIRYSFAITPWEQFVAATGADRLLAWADDFDYAASLIAGFTERLAAALADIRPVGRALAREEEMQLARYCYVLGLFENVFRSGYVADALAEAFYSHPDKVVKGRSRRKQTDPTASEAEVEACVVQLLASVADHWADDLASLGTLATDRLGHLVSQPVNLNPTFAGSRDVGGADADLIVNGCLIDLKASINPVIDAKWLRQLAGYVLLDYEDEHHIDSVGVYMARQGALLRWPLDEFVHMLTGDAAASVADLRREFRTLCTAPRPIAEGTERGRSGLMPAELAAQVLQASQDEKCVLCGTALVCTYEENVEREGPRGRTHRVHCLTVRCTACDAHAYREYPPSSLPPTPKWAQKQRAELIHGFNDMAVTDRW